MLIILRKIMKTGVATKDSFALTPTKKYRGKLTVDGATCTACTVCVTTCPVSAITIDTTENETRLSFDYTKCMYCGLCADVCPENAIIQTNEPKICTKQREQLIETFLITSETGDQNGTDN